MSNVAPFTLLQAGVVVLGLLHAPTLLAEANATKQNTLDNKSAQTISAPELKSSEAVLKEEAKQKIMQFASTLKQALMAAIEEGGLSNGVEVCSEKAPEIASSLSTDGWTVKRTSLKTRNQNNQPDEWEHIILKEFAAKSENGEDITTLVSSRYEEGKFRMMKAIPTGSVCLACHGSSVDDKTLEKINAIYPNDQARGFSAGELRGAFSLTKVKAE